MLSPSPLPLALFDSTGRHLWNQYPPLMVDGQLTEAHAACVAARPAQLLLSGPSCHAPLEQLGLVWVAPAGPNPLILHPEALPYLVHALDAGMSVQLHAETPEAISSTCAVVSPLLGGGHA